MHCILSRYITYIVCFVFGHVIELGATYILLLDTADFPIRIRSTTMFFDIRSFEKIR